MSQKPMTSLFIPILLLSLYVPRLQGQTTPKIRTAEETLKTLKSILARPKEKLGEKEAARAEALRRLKAYRYLAGVPYRDITLDESYNEACEAGARLCEKIGRLDHTPKNPGLPEEEYKLAYRGTSRSNLGMGYATLAQALGGWMDDSDRFNIDRLGHRRWCLHPHLKKVGFGSSGRYYAMYAADRSRRNVPDYDYVAWPPRGPIPVSAFKSSHAWSLSLNPAKYVRPTKELKPKVYRTDEKGKKSGEPLKLGYFNVDTNGYGIPNCIVFRPGEIQIKAGSRFIVELEGVRLRRQRKPTTLRYVVEFIEDE